MKISTLAEIRQEQDMHTQDLTRWTHGHAFDAGDQAGERGTRMGVTTARTVTITT
jgi:hypothetical protein